MMPLAFAIPHASVQMAYLAGSSPLQQIIDILCDIEDIKPFFELGDCQMTSIGLTASNIFQSMLVELQDYLWVSLPTFRRSDILNSKIMPQAANGVSECWNTGFT
jgi:hypothetical protein